MRVGGGLPPGASRARCRGLRALRRRLPLLGYARDCLSDVFYRLARLVLRLLALLEDHYAVVLALLRMGPHDDQELSASAAVLPVLDPTATLVATVAILIPRLLLPLWAFCGASSSSASSWPPASSRATHLPGARRRPMNPAPMHAVNRCGHGGAPPRIRLRLPRPPPLLLRLCDGFCLDAAPLVTSHKKHCLFTAAKEDFAWMQLKVVKELDLALPPGWRGGRRNLSESFGAREFTVVGRPQVLMIRHSLCQAGWKVLVPTNEFELIFSSLLWCSEPSILIMTEGSVRSMPCSMSSQERVHVSRNFQAR